MRRIFIALVAAAMALAASPAGAQAGAEVAVGDTFTIENGTECPPNGEVVATVEGVGGASAQLGLAIADPRGHFSLEARMPDNMPLGAATVTAECGLAGAVLVYDVVVVEASSTDLLGYAPYVAIGVAAVAVVVAVVRSRSRRNGDDSAEDADAEAPPVAEVEEGALADHDDDAEYWYWDNATERGPVKRIACLNETAFFLHEVPADKFGKLVENLATYGPDRALANAFFRVPVGDIDEVHHRGTQLRLTFRGAEEKQAQVIDLGTEVTGVVDLLSRRVHVVADAPVPSV